MRWSGGTGIFAFNLPSSGIFFSSAAYKQLEKHENANASLYISVYHFLYPAKIYQM
jgi:hypothetical protein